MWQLSWLETGRGPRSIVRMTGQGALARVSVLLGVALLAHCAPGVAGLPSSSAPVKPGLDVREVASRVGKLSGQRMEADSSVADRPVIFYPLGMPADRLGAAVSELYRLAWHREERNGEFLHVLAPDTHVKDEGLQRLRDYLTAVRSAHLAQIAAYRDGSYVRDYLQRHPKAPPVVVDGLRRYEKLAPLFAAVSSGKWLELLSGRDVRLVPQ